MKIPNNSLVEIHGWVMLKKVKSGKKYLIIHDDAKSGDFLGQVYWFCTPSSKKAKIGHFSDDVDCWVNPENHPNLNKIVVLK